jgi:hypothetical protein
VAKGLFPDEIPLTPGKVSVKEFTPTESWQIQIFLLDGHGFWNY